MNQRLSESAAAMAHMAQAASLQYSALGQHAAGGQLLNPQRAPPMLADVRWDVTQQTGALGAMPSQVVYPMQMAQAAAGPAGVGQLIPIGQPFGVPAQPQYTFLPANMLQVSLLLHFKMI